MNTIYNLCKKDFLLIKNYLAIMLVFIVMAPIFVSYRTPTFQEDGNIIYNMLVVMITFMVYHSVSMEEMKQKGEIYLRITPMSINKVIIAKYVVVTFSFIVTTSLFLVLSNIPQTLVGKVDIKNILLIFSLVELFFGVYIPMTFKFGYIKLQMIGAIFIFLLPFIISIMLSYLGKDISLITNIKNNSTWAIASISLLMACASVILGTMVSNKIIENKEY